MRAHSTRVIDEIKMSDCEVLWVQQERGSRSERRADGVWWRRAWERWTR
jgi:hypothetical protein